MTLIKQNICINGGYDPTPYRNDGVLGTPVLLYPRDGANICLEGSVTYTSQIVFTWSTVIGALEYIVEWSNDASFSGPSLRAAITSNTYYALDKNSDIRLGEAVYWRVFARNGTGSLSEKTIPRKISFNCPDFSSPDRADNFDVNILIHGDDYIRCCEQKMWSSEISYICEDQVGRPIASLDSLEWELSTENGLGEPTIVEASNDVVIVESCGIDRDTSQIFEIKLTATFTDIVRGDTFQKTATRKVFLDCHSTVRDQPWARVFQDYPIMSIPGYYDDAPLGYMTHEDFVMPTDYNYQMITAVGPVFKVPVTFPGCSSPNVELDCCECFPETIGFQIETEYGVASGTLKWDGSKHVYDGEVSPSTSNLCSSVTFHAELVCDGENFVFSATETCDSACIGLLCGKGVDADTLQIEYEAQNCATTAVVDTGSFTLTEVSTGVYTTENIEVCPGSGQFIYLNIDLNNNTKEVRRLSYSGYALQDDVILFGAINPDICTTTSFRDDFQVLEEDGSECCIYFSLTGLLCDDNEVYTLDPPPFTFENCSNPSAIIQEDWKDIISSTTASAFITLGGSVGAEPLCGCSGVYDDYGINVDYYALEARINIPIGCGLKFENGVISLDLETIAGHGIRVGETEYGCPYLFIDWRAGTQYCCEYGCYCCEYDDLVICVDGTTTVLQGDGEPTVDAGIDGGSP
jgi:hypothetical protein